MSDLTDLRRRAAQQSKHGNYWAGKVPHLIDRITRYEKALRRIAADGCENCTLPDGCRHPGSGHTRDGDDLESRWCAPCFALDALGESK